MEKTELEVMIGGFYVAYIIAIIITLHNEGYKKRWIFLLDLFIPFGGLIRVVIKAVFYDFIKNTVSAFKNLEK